MPDTLTPKERALIDEAVRAGKVTPCPPQTHSLSPDELADPRKRKHNRSLNYMRGKRLRAADLRTGFEKEANNAQ